MRSPRNTKYMIISSNIIFVKISSRSIELVSIGSSLEARTPKLVLTKLCGEDGNWGTRPCRFGRHRRKTFRLPNVVLPEHPKTAPLPTFEVRRTNPSRSYSSVSFKAKNLKFGNTNQKGINRCFCLLNEARLILPIHQILHAQCPHISSIQHSRMFQD